MFFSFFFSVYYCCLIKQNIVSSFCVLQSYGGSVDLVIFAAAMSRLDLTQVYKMQNRDMTRHNSSEEGHDMMAETLAKKTWTQRHPVSLENHDNTCYVNCLPRRALEIRIKNRKRSLGRTRLRWIGQIREELQARGVKCTTIMNEECRKDRDVWRRLSRMTHKKNGSIL